MERSTRLALLVGVLAGLSGCSGSKAGTPARGDAGGWWTDRVFYEVFVRSFADSNGDGVGDLPGLVAKLDVLNDGDPATTTDLGVDALWLMPIFPAASYHGYDVTDYRSVDPLYGTIADVDALVSTAHARGVRVVLDLVLNHTSTQHPWFLDSRSSAAASRRDWYLWRATNPGWTQTTSSNPVWHPYGGSYYYGYFWDQMPDLNLRNAAVEAELLEVMRFWLARGVDGFRLDAVRHYYEGTAGGLVDRPETHAYLARTRRALQADYPEVLLVAETWTEPEIAVTYWGAGDEAQLGFFFRTGTEGIKKSVFFGVPSWVVSEVQRAQDALAGKDRSFQAPFLSNHDVGRAMFDLSGDPRMMRVATATLLALPGTPFLYYGDEIGMQGGTSDPAKRTPLRWTAAAPGYGFTTAPSTWYAAFGATSEAAGVDVATQRADAGSLWHLHRRVVAVRSAHAALRRGDLTFPALGGGGAGALAILRATPGDRVLFLVNYAATPTGAFTVAAAGNPTVIDADGLVSAATASGGAIQVPGLGARSWAFLSLP